jgi:HEPN domain-containing protein
MAGGAVIKLEIAVTNTEVLRWFDEALWDLDTAKILHGEKRYNAAAFYSHQASEKALRSLLYNIGEIPRGHSVRELLQRYFAKVGREPDERLLGFVRELDRHYIISRYPNALPSGTPHEAYDEEASARAIKAAEEVVKFAERELSFFREQGEHQRRA